jgi:hypothetical protein
MGFKSAAYAVFFVNSCVKCRVSGLSYINGDGFTPVLNCSRMGRIKGRAQVKCSMEPPSYLFLWFKKEIYLQNKSLL